MSKASRTDGLRPGHDRDAADVLAQINNLRSVLGAQQWVAMGGTGDYAAQAGTLNSANFSETAGIVESKIQFGTQISATHNHDPATSNWGAKLADESISDLQIHWDSDNILFGRSFEPGMIMRFGYWDNERVRAGSMATYGRPFAGTGGYDNEGDELTNPEPTDHRIYFSTGHDYQRSATRTTEEAGSPFPVGSSPVVVFSPDGRFSSAAYGVAPATPYLFPAYLRDTLNSADPNGLLADALWRVNFSISTVTHEYFDIRVHIPSNNNAIGVYADYVYGIFWVAMYSPGMGTIF